MIARAGLAFNLAHRVWTQDGQNYGWQSATDDTTARVGATIKLGKADMDFVVGNNATGQTETATDMDTQNFSFAGGLFTAVALTYNW
jgi:hypothetical protein